MKAIVCRKYGPPEVLALEELPRPTPKENEVLIKIYATAVTASDVLIRGLAAPWVYRLFIQLMMGVGKPRNPVMGMVVSGVVEQTGKGVTSFNVGDSVFASGSMSSFKLRFGAYAEYMCLPEDWALAKKPTNVSFEEAAAIPYGAGLAWFYIKKMQIKRGDKVLIYGASGSVGLMATQLAKHAGAIVTAVCSEKNFYLLQSLGADKMIDYTLAHSSAQLEAYDFVFDAVGKSKTSDLKIRSKQALSPKGKYISVDDKAPTTSKNDFLSIMELVEQSVLKPTIDRIFALEQMVEAHTYVEQGRKKGSVVISLTTREEA